MMKQYTKLLIPANTAWDRFKWGRYIHWRIRYFFKGIYNIIRWSPIIYHDKDWDHYYITRILQKKIEFQRNHLVYANRHTNINRDNFWMTIVLNLLEREHSTYYGLEKWLYKDSDIEFIDSTSHIGSYEMIEKIHSDNLHEYISKYPSAVRAISKIFPEESNNKEYLSLRIGKYRQDKCRNLIFEILKRYSAEWWD